jgi:hypothetical protein
MNQWISVKDRLPDFCQHYLVTNGRAQMVAAFNLSGVWDFFDNAVFWDSEDVTHWMPLPQPPENTPNPLQESKENAPDL